MPMYSIFMLFFIMSNIALPGTSSFVGEFLLLNGLFQDNFFSASIAGTSVVFSGAYSLWLYNRIMYGNIKTNYLILFFDLKFNEFLILFILSILVLIMGLFPSFFLNFIHSSVNQLFTNINTSLLQ